MFKAIMRDLFVTLWWSIFIVGCCFVGVTLIELVKLFISWGR